MEGFGLVDVLDSFVPIHCSMYCDITVFTLNVCIHHIVFMYSLSL